MLRSSLYNWRPAALSALAQSLVQVRRPARRRRVLYVAHNRLMVAYLERVHALLKDDPRLVFAMATPPDPFGEPGGKALATEMGVAWARHRWSRWHWWDLVVFADHDNPYRWHPRVPKVRVLHGLGSGKVVDGQPYVYGRRWVLRPDGRPVYSAILEASETLKQAALACTPELEGSIEVVGDLRADELLARNEDRGNVRERLGFAETDRVVILCSTWGRHALFPQMGKRLVDAADAMMRRGGWQFVVSAHTSLWRAERPGGGTWSDWLLSLRARGFTVIEPDQSWTDALVAGDLMVVDHCSLNMLFALLAKPVLPVPVTENQMLANSLMGRVRSVLPPLEDGEDLESRLEGALETDLREELQALSAEIDSHPGGARERIREQIYRLLGLEPG